MQSSPTATIPPRAQAPVVRDLPYVAAFECHDVPSGKAVLSGEMFRDSAGRFRIDYHSDEFQIHIIDDVVKSSVFIVFANAGAFETEKYGSHRFDWSFRSAVPSYTGETAEILGIPCERVSFTLPERTGSANADAGDTWISGEHGIVLKETSPDEGWVWELTTLDRREPDAGTFDVPAGFVDLANDD